MKHRIVIDYDDETGDVKLAKPEDVKTAVFMLGHALTGVSQVIPEPNDSGLVLASPKLPADVGGGGAN